MITLLVVLAIDAIIFIGFLLFLIIIELPIYLLCLLLSPEVFIGIIILIILIKIFNKLARK